MNEAKDLGIGGVLENGFKAGLVVVHILLNLTTLNIKYIDQHLHISEDILSLAGEVVVHKHLLTAKQHNEHRGQQS